MTAMDTGHSTNGHIDALVAWAVLVPRQYADLVSSRKGEALVILAHYGALVHSRREKWIFYDGGRFLIESISHYFGPRWYDWLAWPQQILTEKKHCS